MAHKIRILQVFRVERVIEIEVPDDYAAQCRKDGVKDPVENMIEELKSGSQDIPSYEDPRWQEAGRELWNEEVTRG